ncbi:MAG TPA: DNA mismatch repair endonuclease MutL [Ktedonobacterales bacterium]
MPIRQLDPDVAAKIAAGEVVERPASVVKELVENALDAGARSIRVELANGGLSLIRVTDDGGGIPATELPLAFARHATSKVTHIEDLERIQTLGFRGEALASIAAVAGVTLVSRQRDETAGAQLSVVEGAVGAVTLAGAPVGTSVSVRDLFASVPARLKFLKTRSTETGHALHVVEQYAFAFPEIRFTVLSEGRQVFSTSGDGGLLGVIAAVYGLSVAEQMVALPGAPVPSPSPFLDDPHAATRPLVDGFVSRPSCYKATRSYLSFFVNRRYVQSRTLSYAVEEAYHSLLLTGRHPVAVIAITLDPALVDVNVHPAKTDVKFLHERQVYAAVQRSVRAAVLATAEAPEVSTQAFVMPSWGIGDSTPDAADAEDIPSAPGILWQGEASAREPGDAPDTRGDERAPLRGGAGGFPVPSVAAEGPVGGRALPVLRVLGQVSQSYIITEGPDGVYMVDQHAAHERILLERMIADWRARSVSSQLLLQPIPIELSASERDTLEDHLDELRAIGFELEAFGGDALLVRAMPAVLASRADDEPLGQLLLELVGAGHEAASHGETWEEHALANVACKAAIKAGQTLAPEEQRELIRQLEGTSGRQSCCHGRPTMVHLSLAALERQFDRR